ncbi:ROK family protein [Arthrobacter sp. M4]|uniref:ROK family protein n=1 Tax=Arthrobacter sp. M4 TaxID=218160 RepID=UPI001CDC0C67|nr:ROK family protein [Arthrobacter sp. M4]MCA4131231.1 ROK family protein [Arthrobacter sp. M4]
MGDVRRGNLALVLGSVASFLAAESDARPSRAQVAAATGLTKASVSSLVSELLDAGLVREIGVNRAGERGRPGVGLELSTQKGVLGLEINVDYISAGLVDLAGTLRFHKVMERQNSGASPEAVMLALSGLVKEAVDAASEARMDLLGGGLAVPGLVDTSRNTVVAAPNLHWTGVVLDVDRLLPESPFGMVLFNEANSAALAELWYGEGPRLRDFLYVSGEVGVGGGLVMDSELFTGPGGHAGELGHVVVDPAGPPCSCGGRGCLEVFSGLEAVFSAAGLGGQSLPGRLDLLRRRCAEGDPKALSAVARAGRSLGVALVSAARLVDLPSVVLGGHFAILGEWVIPALLESLEDHAPGLIAPDAVLPSTLDQSAALLGAAGSAIHSVLESPHIMMSAVDSA